MPALVAALHSNVFITGLNQLSDVAIDRVNKPYLPLVCCANEYPTTPCTCSQLT